MLREQKTYLEIAEKTGASTATISRVNRSLNYGNDGYDMVFDRIGKQRVIIKTLMPLMTSASYFVSCYVPVICRSSSQQKNRSSSR